MIDNKLRVRLSFIFKWLQKMFKGVKCHVLQCDARKLIKNLLSNYFTRIKLMQKKNPPVKSVFLTC